MNFWVKWKSDFFSQFFKTTFENLIEIEIGKNRCDRRYCPSKLKIFKKLRTDQLLKAKCLTFTEKC